ncbi:MAG: hypothetical protein IKV66_15445 [Clostridia bacterium]|jgi:hypothetical protein|nr:hypothetical protein [Clostridia bacterium]
MKKLLLGIAVILFSMTICLIGEFAHIHFFRNELTEVVYVLLSFVGLGLCVMGYFEKDQ